MLLMDAEGWAHGRRKSLYSSVFECMFHIFYIKYKGSRATFWKAED